MRSTGSLVLALTIAVATPVAAAVTGSVVDQNGVPLAHLRVVAYAEETPEAIRARILSGAVAPEPLAVAETSVAGADGYGFANATGLEAAEGESVGGVEVRLEHAGTVRGRVTSNDGRD